ncbi:MAG TPA: DUF1684 domain-containing protein [Candidatus Acidoferrum sp.]|jgi:hypothetical protein|nr:DUF1684 domain-containing protein [Candidatus Acidoferrum sp.]
MRRLNRNGRLVFALLASVFLSWMLFAQDLDLKEDEAAWRAEHTAELLKPDGWLSLVGLEWLQTGDNSVGSAPDNKIRLASGPAHLAVIHLEGENATLNPPKEGFPQDFLVAGSPSKTQTLRAEPNKDKIAPRLTIGTLSMYVIRREARFALRIKDSQSPSIVGFRGLKWYAPGDAYRVNAKWIPYSPFKTITLATLVGTSYDQPVPGAAEFTLNGKTFRLEPVLEDPAVAKLFFILRDTTSTSTTYGACRFLYTGLPTNGLDKAGELMLDFNRLENPPCAYTPFSTCPLPPPGNRLPIPLPVGEKRYHD